MSAFRDEWKKEVAKDSKEAIAEGGDDDESDLVERARVLFLAGAELERTGQLYNAVMKYKKAVQMVPDIEYRVFNQAKRGQTKATGEGESGQQRRGENVICHLLLHHSQKASNVPISDPDDIQELTDQSDESSQVVLDEGAVAEAALVSRLGSLNLKPTTSFIQMEDEELQASESHISCLPMEVLVLILKWVVSDQLDLRSLERCAEVCKGFYMASRAQELWRCVCMSTWGANSLPLNTGEGPK